VMGKNRDIEDVGKKVRSEKWGRNDKKRRENSIFGCWEAFGEEKWRRAKGFGAGSARRGGGLMTTG